MDMWHKIMKWVDHNRGVAASIILAIAVSSLLLGCAITTESTVSPGMKITAPQLQVEVATVTAGFSKRQDALSIDMKTYAAKAEIAQQELTRKAERRIQVIEMISGLGTLAAGGTLNPMAAVGAVTQLATLCAAGGLVYDNRRKDRVINAAAPSA